VSGGWGRRPSDAFRGIVHFGGQGAGTGVLKLLGWLAVGAVLLTLGWVKLQRGRQEVTPAGTGTAEQPQRAPAVHESKDSPGEVRRR